MAKTVILNLAKLPNDFGRGHRLGDLYFITDNLDEPVVFPKEHERFPVKCETFFSLTVVQGTARLQVNMHELEIHQGQTIQLMPGCIFQVTSVTDDFKFYALVVAPQFFEQMRQNIGLHVNPSHRYFSFYVHETEPRIDQRSLKMYELVKAEMVEPDYDYKQMVVQRYCEIWILKMLTMAAQQRAKMGAGWVSAQNMKRIPEYQLAGRKAQIFSNFIALLAEHCVGERTMAYYAGQMQLTPKYLSNTIKEVSGKSGLRWIDDYVLLEAKALLRSGITVKAVSMQLHYPTQSMFGRFFKKMTGYSPREYQLL